MSRQLHLDTANAGGHNRRYSFLQTPLEMHAPGEQTPASADSTQLQQNQQQPQPQPTAAEQQQPTSNIINEKVPHRKDELVASPYTSGSPPPAEQHPANYAPYADEMDQLQPQPPVQPQHAYQFDSQVPQYSHQPVPNSPGPLPIKANLDQGPRSPPVGVAPDTNPLQSPQFPRFPPPTATGTSQVAAPEDITEYHQPGQVRHPNQDIKGGTWSHSLCDCSNISTCCLGIFCPCVLYGKTQYRLSLKSNKEDPTNMLGYESCNGACTGMALLCGCQCA